MLVSNDYASNDLLRLSAFGSNHQPLLTQGETLYISTDENNREFFAALRKSSMDLHVRQVRLKGGTVDRWVAE
jgi:hypothetical protein